MPSISEMIPVEEIVGRLFLENSTYTAKGFKEFLEWVDLESKMYRVSRNASVRSTRVFTDLYTANLELMYSVPMEYSQIVEKEDAKSMLMMQSETGMEESTFDIMRFLQSADTTQLETAIANKTPRFESLDEWAIEIVRKTFYIIAWTHAIRIMGLNMECFLKQDQYELMEAQFTCEDERAKAHSVYVDMLELGSELCNEIIGWPEEAITDEVDLISQLLGELAPDNLWKPEEEA